MTTVKQLIKQLKEYHDPDEPIIFQYIVADYTDYSESDFESIAEYLMDNDSFGDESANFFASWMEEARDCIYTHQEEEEE